MIFLVRPLEALSGLRLHGLLDVADDCLGLLLAAVDEEPARTLRVRSANDENSEADHGTEEEGEAPADARRSKAVSSSRMATAEPMVAPTQ